MIDRRGFLWSSGAAATVLALGPRASARELSSTHGGTEAGWLELSRALGGQVYVPGSPGFAERARVNNLRYMRLLPRVVAVVDTPERAQAAIEWCRVNGVAFRIKGGGHSYAGFSTCPELVISTRGMDAITPGNAPGTVRAGAGALNYAVYDALSLAGRTVTHGRCPTVGLAGFLLGGGIGFDMRRLGMASDMLVGAEIVLADGDIVWASESANADLFWALRGGAGGNFGLSTAFEFRTDDIAGAEVSAFHRQYRTKAIPEMARLLHDVMSACETMPNAWGSRISVQYIKPDPGIAEEPYYLLDMVGQFLGERAPVDTFFAQFDGRVPPRVLVDFHGQYWKGQHALEEPDETSYYQERSTFLRATPSEAGIAGALDHLSRRPDVHGTCDLRFFQTGGAVNDVSPDATAYVHRDSQWLALVGYYWKERDTGDEALIEGGHEWQDALYEVLLRDFGGKGAFQNFPDIALTDWAQAYYGSNLERLRAIKARYDPKRLFDFDQAV